MGVLVLSRWFVYSTSLRIGTMRGFICAMYTIAHIIQQQTVAVMTKVRCNKLVEGPLLKQILVHIEAMMPTKANIKDVTRKAIVCLVPDPPMNNEYILILIRLE
uniref:Uncharacterized protein n=1 Tax=Noccaea caerulescens TaxID=107243 RepID=A0A1J3J8Q8_NOCCA